MEPLALMPPEQQKEQMNNFRIVDGLAEITRHHDRSILEKSLLKTIADIYSGDARLYRVIEDSTEDTQVVFLSTYCENGVIDSLSLADSPLHPLTKTMSLVLTTGQIQSVVTSDDDIWNTYYPTFDASGNIFAILVYIGEQLDFDRQRLIHSILKVYTNYLSLLDKAQHDRLTGLLNRETLDSELTKAILDSNHHLAPLEEDVPDYAGIERRHEHDKKHTYIGLLDVDRFKQINDQYGHLFGDEILILTARLLKNNLCRREDLVFRYGGEEFVVLLQSESSHSAFIVLDRIRQTIENHNFPQIGQVTASIGFTQVEGRTTASDIIGKADRALYYAKENGRNQTIDYNDLVAKGIVIPHTITDDIDLF